MKIIEIFVELFPHQWNHSCKDRSAMRGLPKRVYPVPQPRSCEPPESTAYRYLEDDLLWRANRIVACLDKGYLQCFKPEVYAAQVRSRNVATGLELAG